MYGNKNEKLEVTLVRKRTKMIEGEIFMTIDR